MSKMVYFLVPFMFGGWALWHGHGISYFDLSDIFIYESLTMHTG